MYTVFFALHRQLPWQGHLTGPSVFTPKRWPGARVERCRKLVPPGAVPKEAARLLGMLGFVHPLVRHAVSEGLSETERRSGTPARHAYFLKGLRR